MPERESSILQLGKDCEFAEGEEEEEESQEDGLICSDKHGFLH